MDTRSRILVAAVKLVRDGGTEAATTRAVASAAAVQAPVIYRLFGDKHGLLDAVAEQTLREFVAGKNRGDPGPDPVEDLFKGFRAYIEFSLANPDIFVLMYARPGQPTKAAAIGHNALRERAGMVDAAHKAVLAAVTGTTAMGGETSLVGNATALRARLGEVAVLSPGEHMLMDELLERIANAAASAASAPVATTRSSPAAKKTAVKKVAAKKPAPKKSPR